jgi:glycosyltransferase involved in cell wall biosynthesis
MKKKFLISRKIINPFFTVVTVVKNHKNLISKTISSIKNQSFKNFEYVVIDGNSNDGTLDIILSNKKNINFLISENDKGIYYAMNKAIKIAKGKVIVFVNSGDILTNNALKIIHKQFIKKPKIDFVFGTVKRHYTTSKILKYGFDINKLKYNFDFATSHSTGFYIKLSSLKKIGNFNTKYRCSADYDFYYRAIIKEKLIGNSTRKGQLIGIMASGGYSSSISFFEHLLEETKIRIDNGQNIFLIFLIFFNAIIKSLFKKIL